MHFDSSLLVLLPLALVAATINGGLGYGFSSVTVPVALLFYANRVLNPALVLVEVFLNVLALWVNRRALSKVAGRVWPMLVGAVPGVVLGSYVLSTASHGPLKLATYAVLLPLIMLQTTGLRRPIRNERLAGAPLGAAVGALYAATTISGPPLALLFNNQGLAKEELRAALSLFRIVESTFTAAMYLVLGLYSRESVELSLWLAPVIAVGLPLGHWLLRRVEPETFRRTCMGTDAVLVSFGLARIAIDLHLAPPASAYAGMGLVVLAEAALLVRYFRRLPRAAKEAQGEQDLPVDFPIALRLRGRSVLLVGAGKIATGRLSQLLEIGAQVHVVAPAVSEEIRAFARDGRIRLSERPYVIGDVTGSFVAFTAADSAEVNRAVVGDAQARGVLVNAADDPELCDFTVPSIGRRGPVVVAVTTSGLAPGLARTIRDRALAAVGPEYGRLARLFGRLRERLPSGSPRVQVVQALVEGGAAELIAKSDGRGLRRLLRQALGRRPKVQLAIVREGEAP